MDSMWSPLNPLLIGVQNEIIMGTWIGVLKKKRDKCAPKVQVIFMHVHQASKYP